MKTKLGMLNAIVDVELDKRSDHKTGQYSYDFHMNVYQNLILRLSLVLNLIV